MPDPAVRGCAIVFGASGAIGFGVAECFAVKGVDLVLTARSDADTLSARIARAPFDTVRVEVRTCDITQPGSVREVVASANELPGGIASVVTAHGAQYGTGTVADGPLDQLRLKLDMDLFGFLHVVQAIVPAMRARGGGSIATVVTPAIDKLSPGYGLASAPKVAVAKLVEYLALEEGVHGIRANAVAPGVLTGGMADKILQGPAKDVIEAAIRQTPLGRMGTVNEVAELLVYLASPAAGYITGQIIDIDGGYSL